MIYTEILDVSRTHFIAIMPNYNDNNEKIGTKLHIKTFLPREITDNNYRFANVSENQNLFNRYSNLSDTRFDNLIILSAKLNNIGSKPLTLITQKNINHNIKFIHKDNDFKQPRIIFTKYCITDNIINNKQYLFNPINSITDLTQISLLNNNINIDNTDADVNDKNGINYLNLNNLDVYLNYFRPYGNSDYFGMKFNDFIDLSYVSKRQLDNYDLNNLTYIINNITPYNNFANNNLYNYDINNFTKLFYTTNSIYDNNIVSENFNIFTLNSLIPYSNDNMILYNTYDNITIINLTYRYLDDNLNNIIHGGYTDISINFCLLKTYNYYVNKENYGKIFISPNFIYMNARIIDINSNFYDNNNTYNTKRNSGYIYLSFGNSISGLTQGDLFKHTKIDLTPTIYSTIQYTKTYKTSIDKICFYSSLTNTATNDMKNRDYLLNDNYNYNYDNILSNNIITSNIKIIDICLNDLYYSLNNDFSFNIFKNKFNNLSILNNSINKNYFYDNYNSSYINYILNNTYDLSYDSLSYKLEVNGVFPYSVSALSTLYNNILSKSYNYDFRFNYSNSFIVDSYLTTLYSYPNTILNFASLSDYNNRLLLNNNKIIISTYFETSSSSDFTNVDCIFVYHDPYSSNTPLEFRYPNNNIEITKNPNIDTLVRAIQLLPGARTSTTNSTFIPYKNSSNLSRKMIQGLIGFNDVPALLSIEPYDENIITGRGFINQFQLNDTCKTYTEQVITKLNSQKHISAKNNIESNINNNYNRPISKKQQFANIVRGKSYRRNPNINIKKTDCQVNPENIKTYYTPFLNRHY